jgi:GT2 family glycosyltransferase
MDLSIITVNWNSVGYLRQCLASIYSNTRDLTFEIVVVDNASPNGDVDTLLAMFPGIKIIKSGTNLGFARANNLGFWHSNGATILLLNPDTKLVGPAINKLVEAFETLPDVGIVGARHVNPDLTVQTTSIQRFPSILREVVNIEALRRRWPQCGLWSIGPLFSGGKRPVRVEVIPGACMLMRREVFEQVGMFSEGYFMYAEDIDLNYKIAKAGYTNYFIPDATLIHYGGASSSQRTGDHWATRMQLHAMSQYYAKTRGREYAGLYRAAMGVCAAGRLLAIALASPFWNAIRGKQALRRPRQKWTTVLRWALGMDGSLTSAAGTQ